MIKLKYEKDKEFKTMLLEEEKRLGFIPDVESLARMMAYVLMNKIIFYKVRKKNIVGSLHCSPSTRLRRMYSSSSWTIILKEQ
ncbi:MAG: hypothetical protein QXO15_02600 [Nitrososphaerota archaeon]